MIKLISKKQIILLLAVFPLVLGIFTLAMPVAYASPKSLYLCAEHHTSQFDAWTINPDGTVTYQATYNLIYTSDPAGIAIDESSATLFTTSEFSYGIEMFDAIGLTTVGYAGSAAGLPQNLAGIDVDDANDIVYTIRRWTDDLYLLDWNPTTTTLTLRAGYPINLPGCSGAFGAALDETTGKLWVADSTAGVARAYDVNTWTEDTSLSFTPSHKPVDIAVDRQRGFVYSVSMSAGASVPSGCGSYLISKFDLATSTETTHNIGHQGVGIAVDEVTGYVYVTGSPTGTPPYDNLEVWNPATWAQVQQTGDIGNPAGICIPQAEVAYNPLNLQKIGPASANPGDTITYSISFDNLGNNFPVNNVVLVDDLPPEVSFVSATGGGGGYPWSYDPITHRVTWNIGTLPALAPTDTVTVTVTINLGLAPGSKIINYATIDSDETPSTTVYLETEIPPEVVIPEVPWGTVTVSALMIIAFATYIALPRFRRGPKNLNH